MEAQIRVDAPAVGERQVQEDQVHPGFREKTKAIGETRDVFDLETSAGEHLTGYQCVSGIVLYEQDLDPR
jgi:hypothetical protein